MGRRFNCSSSSSYDDEETAATDYTSSTNDYNGSNTGGVDYGAGSSTHPTTTRLFQEAEELITRGMENIFGGTVSCGIPKFKTGNKSRGGAGVGGSSDVFGDDIDEGVKLDWRKDPYHSMSDWTLIVRDGRNRQPQTYHIHKSVLSYGQRKSGFFIKVFERNIMEGGGKNKGDGSTEVALPKTAALHVPQLLDFIYFDKLDLNAQCAPPLRFLANTFDVRELYALVSSFIQSDLSEATITTYIRESEAVKDKELQSLSMNIAANKFDAIPNESLLILPPHVFQQLTSNPQLNCPSSERLSQRIATYARGRSDEMNDEVFYFMTHAQILPRICPTEAMWFLNFSSSKFGNVLVDDSMGGYEGTLKRRCIVAAAQNWRELLVGSIRDEIRRKIDGGNDGGNASSIGGGTTGLSGDGSPARRRLFVDGDGETNLDKGRGYMSLPLDIRVELLEEALLQAATSSNGENSSSNSGQSTNEKSQDFEHMLNVIEPIKKERRGDVSRRETKKGKRERRGAV